MSCSSILIKPKALCFTARGSEVQVKPPGACSRYPRCRAGLWGRALTPRGLLQSPGRQGGRRTPGRYIHKRSTPPPPQSCNYRCGCLNENRKQPTKTLGVFATVYPDAAEPWGLAWHSTGFPQAPAESHQQARPLCGHSGTRQKLILSVSTAEREQGPAHRTPGPG